MACLGWWVEAILFRTRSDTRATWFNYDYDDRTVVPATGPGGRPTHAYDAAEEAVEAGESPVSPRLRPARSITPSLRTPAPHSSTSSPGRFDYGHRYYEPGLGRWLNRDPIGEDGGIAIYLAMNNSAISIVDYLGLARSVKWEKWKTTKEDETTDIREVADMPVKVSLAGVMKEIGRVKVSVGLDASRVSKISNFNRPSHASRRLDNVAYLGAYISLEFVVSDRDSLLEFCDCAKDAKDTLAAWVQAKSDDDGGHWELDNETMFGTIPAPWWAGSKTAHLVDFPGSESATFQDNNVNRRYASQLLCTKSRGISDDEGEVKNYKPIFEYQWSIDYQHLIDRKPYPEIGITYEIP